MHRVLGKLLDAEDVERWLKNELKSNDEWKTPCLPAVLLISCSKQLLDYAILAYVTGLGVYLGFLWHTQLDTHQDNNDSRNIFIVYVVSVFLCCVYHLIGNWKDRKECSWQRYLKTVKRIPCEHGFYIEEACEPRSQPEKKNIYEARSQECAEDHTV
jgi:hypothetical protein